jgi:hypothetical protein
MQVLARRSAGAIARLLVVLLTLGTSVPIVAHGDAGHDPCDTVEAPNHAAARVQAADSSAARQHCDVCHWLRSLRAFDIVVARPAVVVAPIHAQAPIEGSTTSRLSLGQKPSRAPPA